MLHRRSAAVRPKIIHSLCCVPLPQVLFFSLIFHISPRVSLSSLISPFLFHPLSFLINHSQSEHAALMYIATEAGTYIKEFVHSDLGRTHPSVASILERQWTLSVWMCSKSKSNFLLRLNERGREKKKRREEISFLPQKNIK